MVPCQVRFPSIPQERVFFKAQNHSSGGSTVQKRFAVVRGVPSTYERCIRDNDTGAAIDVARARMQHRRYCAALESAGLALIRVGADDRFPDCCFVEDPLLILGRCALTLNMGAVSRRGEAEGIRPALPGPYETHEMRSPATAEGGDVIVVGKRVFVGLSSRTNRAGFDVIRSIARREGYSAVPVEIRNALHLKSVCTPIGEQHMIMAPGFLDETAFSGFQCIHVAREEAYSANCLDINGRVLVASGFASTAALVAGAGFETIDVPMSEFRQGGGGLTCLSIIL
jgi:dimethylargininase